MRADHPLAEKEAVTVDDLIGEELIISAQSIKADLPRWCGQRVDELHFAGTCNLSYNGVRCAEAGLGLLLGFEHLANSGISQKMCFRPLAPRLTNRMFLIWKKYQIFTPIAEAFLKTFL